MGINKKKKKVLFILTFPPPYHGANVNNNKLWDSKVQEEFDCSLMDISDHRDLNNIGKFEFVNVFLAFKHMFTLAIALLKYKPDLVYMQISQLKWAVVRDGGFLIIIKWLSRSKVVCQLRGAQFKFFYDNSARIMKKYVDFVLKKSISFILLGEGLKYNFSKWSENLYVVPNGTDLLLDYSIKEKEESRKPTEIVLIYISNFYKSKGIIDVVKSVKSIVKKFPDINIKYKFAGEWSFDPKLMIDAEVIKKEINDIIKEARIEEYVDFVGIVEGEDKKELFKEGDIFLLPTSFNEGQPLSIIEAMSAACVVISSPIAAIPDTVVDGETGFMINPHNPEILIEKIAYLIENENIRKKMSNAARLKYEQQFKQDNVIDNFIKVFNQIIIK